MSGIHAEYALTVAQLNYDEWRVTITDQSRAFGASEQWEGRNLAALLKKAAAWTLRHAVNS